jgi:hypothetical protein
MDNFTIKNKIVALIAKRESGKSQLLRYMLLQSKREFAKIFCICPTECVNNFYSDIIPKENIFDHYSEEWVDSLIKKMTEINSGKSDKESKHILLILDDCCSDSNFHQSKTLKKLATRGRHIKISLMITCQYIYQIPPIIRNNCDYVLCGQMNQQSIQLLTQEFMMGDISKKDFLDLYHSNTSDYGFLVINNNSSSDNNNIDTLYGSIKTPQKYIEKM